MFLHESRTPPPRSIVNEIRQRLVQGLPACKDFTGRSPMTTRRAVGAPPHINPRSTVLPMLSGPSSRMISRTRSIGFPFQAVTISPPARADGPFGSMLTTRTPLRPPEDCDPLDA